MLWLVPLLPVGAAALLWAGAGGPGAGPPPDGRRGLLGGLGALSLLGTAALAAVAAAAGWGGGLAWSEAIALRIDFAAGGVPAPAVMAVLVPLLGAAVVLFAARHEDRRGLPRLLALLIFFVGAMELLVLAADLLTLLVGWELVGACSWALIAHEWRDRENPRGADVAFLATRAGDLGLFLAAAAAFAGTGGFGYEALAGLSGVHLHLLVAGLFVAAAAKSAQVPFAPWLFDAMRGPVSVSALLHAATMVAGGAFLVVRLHPVLDRVAWFAPAAVLVGLATALGGGLTALLQPHAKKLLAGSTSAHYGLMFTAAGAGYPGVALLHLVAHACFKAPLFLAAGVAESRSGSYRLDGMAVGSAVPWIAALSASAALALAGVPPLGGAWTKEAVVGAAGHHAAWAAVAAAVAGGLSAAYAARFQLQAFGRGGGESPERSARWAERSAVAALAAVTAGLSLLWWPGASEAAGRLLDAHLPAFRTWELLTSLGLVTLGLGLGWRVARRHPALGGEGRAAAMADWLGLRTLAAAAIARPARAAAGALAVFDDRLVDGGVRGAVAFAGGVSRALAAFDGRGVDRGVRLAAALADRLARVGDRVGELIADALPRGLSGLVGFAGRDTPRLQTGLSHHYYTLVVVGLAVALVLLALGG